MDISPIVLLAGLIPPLVWYLPHWLKRYLVAKPKPEEDKELQDLSEWEKWAKEGRERKDKELSEWQSEYQELVQKSCKHRYKDSSYRWWRCVDCAHEHEWKWSYDCTCATNSSYSIGGTSETMLYRRDGNCPKHGRPRFVAHEMYKQGKLTTEECLLWDTTVHKHYLPSPTYDYWDKRRLQQLTAKPEVVRLGIAGQREPIIKGN